MKDMSKYSASTAFLDLLFNALVGFTALFFLAFILMNPKEQRKSNVEVKAEFIITVTWDIDKDDDVDSYIMDPLGNLVFFRVREEGLMHLDRDDIGKRNDSVVKPDGITTEYEDNREIITIRGFIPGEYCINVHMYQKRSKEPTNVNVKVEKINPSLRLIAMKDVVLYQNGDEKTICRFVLDSAGNVISVNELEKKLAQAKKTDMPTINFDALKGK